MFDLQLFADTVSGKKIAYLYRLLKDAATLDATHVAFTTENSVSYSRDADVTETKDGAVRTAGATEIEISTTALLAVGDEELIKIHFHTNEPWKVLEYCSQIGEIYDIVIEDMDRQARGLKG